MALAQLDHTLLTLGVVSSRAADPQWQRNRRGRATQSRHSRCRRRGSSPRESSAHTIPHCAFCAMASVVAASRPRRQTMGHPRRSFAMLSRCFHRHAHSPTCLRVVHTGRRNWAYRRVQPRPVAQPEARATACVPRACTLGRTRTRDSGRSACVLRSRCAIIKSGPAADVSQAAKACG